MFETAAHSRFATKSYLAIERPAGAKRDELLARAETECQRFGIGLLTFSHGSAHEDWTVLVEAKRQEPDPRDLERFIEDQIPERDRSRIRKWF